jgi:Rrf2 family transcriptional regulator, nitric oxide-sensitive transcriptional repressor
MKVARDLAASGAAIASRGQCGGPRRAGSAGEIRVGDIVRRIEPDMALVPGSECVIQPACVLSRMLERAMNQSRDRVCPYGEGEPRGMFEARSMMAFP